MKKAGMLAVAVLLILTTASGRASANITDGLIAYYPFSGNANDESGNGHNGAVSGATLTQDRNGTARSAYRFDGIDDVIIVHEDGSFNVGNQLTVSLWIRFLSEPDCRTISFVSKSAVDPVGSNTGFIFPYVGYTQCQALGLIVNTLGPYQWDFQRSFSFASIPNPFDWHLYTATYDGTARRVYLDGTLVATDYQSGAILPNGNDLAIGTQPGTAEWAHAEMDEVRIYNRALSADDVRELSVVGAVIDIDPDRLNLRSLGKWITATIQLPAGYSPADIRIETVSVTLVNGRRPDPALPAVGPSEIGDRNGDGVADLMVKFDRQALIVQLTAGGNEITVSGQLKNGSYFEGTAVIQAIH